MRGACKRHFDCGVGRDRVDRRRAAVRRIRPDGSFVGSGGNPGGPPTRLVDVKVTVTVPSANARREIQLRFSNTESLAIQLASVDGKGVTGVNPTIVNTLPKSRDCKAGAERYRLHGDGQRFARQRRFCGGGLCRHRATRRGALCRHGRSDDRFGRRQRRNLKRPFAHARGRHRFAQAEPFAQERKARQRTTATVTLDAYDASGAEIVGPSDYVDPIALAIQGDANHAFRLHDARGSGESLTITKPTGDITLTYDGNKQASPITLGGQRLGTQREQRQRGLRPARKTAAAAGRHDLRAQLRIEQRTGCDGHRVRRQSERQRRPRAHAVARQKAVRASASRSIPAAICTSAISTPATVRASVSPTRATRSRSMRRAPAATISPRRCSTQDTKTSTTLYPIFIAFDPSGRLVTYGATTVDGNTRSMR